MLADKLPVLCVKGMPKGREEVVTCERKSDNDIYESISWRFLSLSMNRSARSRGSMSRFSESEGEDETWTAVREV